MPDLDALTKNLIKGQAKNLIKGQSKTQLNKLLGGESESKDKDKKSGILNDLLDNKKSKVSKSSAPSSTKKADTKGKKIDLGGLFGGKKKFGL